MKTIFLDLDGVIVNWSLTALKFHGVNITHDQYYPRGVSAWDVVKVCNGFRKKPLSANEFWNSFTEEFWRTLPMFPGARGFVNELIDLYGAKNICIATSCTLQPACASGKLAWIQENLPEFDRQYFIGTPKRFLARPGAILIDDRDKNCEEFRDAGGEAILVPRPWNFLHTFRGDVYSLTLEGLG